MMTTTMMMIIIIGRIACRISKIRPIVIDGVVWSVCQSVCRSVDLSDRTVSPANAKPAEPIEMPFGVWTQVGPNWRHLANTTEPRPRAATMRPYVKLL